MFTERFAIQQRMMGIREERRALNDEYHKLLERLRILDEQSAERAESFPVEYAALLDKLTDAVQSVSSLVPSVTPAQVIEKLKEENPEVVELVEKESEEPAKTETQERIDKEVRRARVAIEASESALKLIKPKDAEPIIMQILKEEGIPLAPIKIKERLEEKGYTTKTSMSDIVFRLSKAGRIESPSFGFWQIARSGENQIQ